MKKLTLVVALLMITGATFAQEKDCCKKKGAKSAACCKDGKNCKKDAKDAPKKTEAKATK